MIFSFLLLPTYVLLACLVEEHGCRPHAQSRTSNRDVHQMEANPADWHPQNTFWRLKRYATLHNANRHSPTDPDLHPRGFDSDEDYEDGNDSDLEGEDEFGRRDICRNESPTSENTSHGGTGNMDRLTSELEARLQRLDEITKSLEKATSKMPLPGKIISANNRAHLRKRPHGKGVDAEEVTFTHRHNLPVLQDSPPKKVLNEVEMDVNDPLIRPAKHFKEILVEELPPKKQPSYEKANMPHKFRYEIEINEPKNEEDHQRMKADASSQAREKLLMLLAQNLHPDSEFSKTDKAYGKKVVLGNVHTKGNSLKVSYAEAQSALSLEVECFSCNK